MVLSDLIHFKNSIFAPDVLPGNGKFWILAVKMASVLKEGIIVGCLIEVGCVEAVDSAEKLWRTGKYNDNLISTSSHAIAVMDSGQT